MAKIKPKVLPTEVANRIREKIRKGLLETGERLVEADLCASLGVSRTPLREALRILGAEGLIEHVPHRGAFVTHPTMDEIRDMFQVMSILEGTCARWAAERIGTAELADLEDLHAQLERHHRNGDREGYIRANHAYHTRLQQLAGNRTIDGVLKGLRQKVLLYRYRQLYQDDRFDQSMEEHRRLIEAFREGDAEKAERVMRAHLTNQCEALVDVYEQGTESGRAR